MSPKAILIFCAQALLAQSAFSYCAGSRGIGAVGLGGYDGCGCGSGLAGGYSSGLGYGAGYGAGLGYGSGYGCNSGVASTGGGLPVSSASPIAPVGVTVLSENAYEGQLCAGGNLPFLGSVALDGVLPTSGAGAVSYGCGDGAISIGNEGPVSTGITIPGAIFPPSSPNSAATADALALVGNGAGLAGYGHGIGGYGLAGAGYGLGGRGCGCSCGY